MIHGGETEISPHVIGLSSRPQGQRLKSSPLPSGPLALLCRLASKASASSVVYRIRFCSWKLCHTPHLKARTKDCGAYFNQHENDRRALQESGECATNIHGRTHPEGPETCSTLVNKCSLVTALWIIESWSPVFQYSHLESDADCSGFSSYTALTCCTRTIWLLFNEVSWWFQVEQ